MNTMKILNYIATGLVFALLFSSCDVNEQFEGLEDMVQPTNSAKYSYTLVDADYKTISDRALKIAANALDSAKARSINTNKFFTAIAPASNYVGLLLDTKYPYSDIMSSSNITYAYGHSSYQFSILNTADYKKAWNSNFLMYVDALTPATATQTVVSTVLNNKFPTAQDGAFRFIEYNYSSVEATTQNVDYKYFYDDFEAHTCATSSPYTPIGEGGWTQIDTAGTKGIYNCRLYSANKYAQITSNATNEKNDAFLFTPQVDLTQAIAPKLTFNINVGYWNATCLQVLVSENYSGDKTKIKDATWVDITSSFTLPEVPASGYGVLASAGEADLTAYVGKKVYIAFKYSGDSRAATSPKITTTYQIDNVKVSEMRDAVSIPSSEKTYAAYTYNGTSWVKLTSEIFYVLEDADYTAMGLSVISANDLVNILPIFLKNKYPYALEGASRNIVYKTSSGTSITQFVLSGGVWSSNSFKINKTEQFIFTVDGWVFDPTVNMEMVTTDYKIMVDYILAHTTLSIFGEPQYKNEEFYYGFGNRYSNVSFRLSYRDPFYFAGRAYQQPASIDAALFALTTPAAKVALLWTRLEEGMNIFLQLRFPNAVPQVSGVDVYYNVKVKVYTPDGVTTSLNEFYIFKYKCTAAGAGGNAPTFEFVSKTKV
jgi:hypothetical protein